MDNVIIPIDLFDDLVENTIECLNQAINNEKTRLVEAYKKDLDRCNEIKDKLSKEAPIDNKLL